MSLGGMQASIFLGSSKGFGLWASLFSFSVPALQWGFVFGVFFFFFLVWYFFFFFDVVSFFF